MREAEALRLQVHEIPAVRKVYELSKRIIMNENLNLIEILKDCPKGTKLYSTIYGKVELDEIDKDTYYPITIKVNLSFFSKVTSDGKHVLHFDGECTLFPSKEQRDWSKFKVKSNNPKFDPNTLQPFDKVLVFFNGIWVCDFYSYYKKGSADFCVCVGTCTNRVIPYNNETEYLLGTDKEAPKFYRYWDE